MTKWLILGGARSGKSTFAEYRIKALCASHAEGNLHYVATATPFDDEMVQRIAHHRARRGAEWCEHEAPLDLTECLSTFTEQDFVLVDCLTVWLNNVIYNQGKPITSATLSARISNLVKVIDQSRSTMIFVSNEVGMGVVPLGEVSRLFVDHAGWMNQAMAEVCDNVTLVAAGLPLVLKGAK